MTLHDDFRAAVLALNPEAYWEFQGLAPGALLDSSGHGHTLTGHGSWLVNNNVIGWDGFQYASFNGIDAYFTMAGSNPLNATAFTVMGIVQPTAGSTDWFDSENAGLTAGLGLIVADAANGNAYDARLGTGTTSILANDTSPFSIYGSGYQMVGVVVDALSATLYINGTPIKSVLYPTRNLNLAQLPQIGAKPGPAVFFRGAISDVYVLSSAQSLLSIRSIAALTPNPVAPSIQVLQATLDQILAAVTVRAY